uniref:RHS repeat domain-containing protein n=1 Tax=Chitinivorax sp. B TaxID=2502235 RepID=UPI0010F9F37E
SIGTSVRYAYDAEGNRVSQTVNGSAKTSWLVDANRDYAQVLEEQDPTGKATHFTYGNDLIYQQTQAQKAYFHYDGLGSTRLLTSDTGSVTDTYAYDAWGLRLNKTGNTNNTYLFGGEQHDAQLGMYYLRARYLNPETGRFVSQDTHAGNLANPITLHDYLYANGDPVGNIDPTGKFSMGSIGVTMAIGGTLNVAINWQANASMERIATNFIVGAAEGVIFGGVFNLGAKLVKFGKFAKFSKNLENLAILKRVGISGALLPGRHVLGERMVMNVGGETVLLKSTALGKGAAKHLQELLGRAPTAGQTTFAEALMLQEVEAAVHVAMREGLVDTAVMNAIHMHGYGAKAIATIVQTPGFTWEMKAELAVEAGKRVIKIFHLQPL